MHHKSNIPAFFDKWQSITGLVLGIFIVFHLVFESSILFGEDTFNQLAKFIELDFLFHSNKPYVVNFLAGFIFLVFIAHAFFAVRKFPQKYQEYKTFKTHANKFSHSDTTLWLVQISTGFILFFVASIHLFEMLSLNAPITAINSSSKIATSTGTLLFLVLLISVVLHAFIGLYRLSVKWIPIEKSTRSTLIKLRNILLGFFLALGIASIIKYIQIGLAQ